MEYSVKVRYQRIGRRKIGRLVPAVKGQYVQRAIANLRMQPQQSSVVLRKAIESGIANAIFQNRSINPDRLWVKEARVDGGPTLKRIRPRARGSADRILKSMSHLTVILCDEDMPVKPRHKKGVGIIVEGATAKKAEVNTTEEKTQSEGKE